MRIIPAIDLLNGKCVRLRKGDYTQQTQYHENPLEVAKTFEDNGIQFLHLVDLDGARSHHLVNHKILEKIARHTDLQIDFGGGLKTTEDVRIAFECGAHQISGGSIAVSNPVLFQSWLDFYGAEKIILGADCTNRKIATQGWLEKTALDVLDFISGYEQKGIKMVICTDIAKDGMLEGTSNELYKEILAKTGIQLIASGGVSCLADLENLKEMGCEGAIIGKALYEGKIRLNELKNIC